MKKTNSFVSTELNTFLSLQSKRVQSRHHGVKGKKEVQRFFEWTERFANLYLNARFARAQDLASAEIAKAQKLARAYIGEGNHDFFATCVDGRNIPTVMFSKPPHVGGVLRAPAGAVTGFMEGQTPDSVYIDHESYVVQQITRLLEERAGETIYYGLDSHVGCAARGLIHSTEGGKQKDSGLRSDVKSKLMTARGLVQLQAELVKGGKKVAEMIPVFFSYDPHSGGVIAGLELQIDDTRVHDEGYTEAILEKLAKEKKIVRTIDYLQDASVLEELEAVMSAGSSDFRHRFGTSMLANWKAITTLYDAGTGKLFTRILADLTAAYSASEWKISDTDDLSAQIISKKTLRQKAKFLLKNLLTRFSIAGASHNWPFGNHKEDMAVITDGGYAPFEKLDAFAVFSRDLNALLPNTKLTIDLIRGFRRSGSITDPVEGSTLSQEEFISAPVLISNKAVLRNANSKVFDAIAQMDLSTSLSAINWDDPKVLAWEKSDIATLLRQTGHTSSPALSISDVLGLVDVLYELFDRLRIMMKDKYFRHMILSGSIVVMNTIVDADRSPRMVVPFVV